MGRDAIQYCQISFHQFTTEFIPITTSSDPLGFAKIAQVSDPIDSTLGSKIDVPGLLCHALNNIIGEADCRFKAIPKSTQTQGEAFVPGVALIAKAKAVLASTAWAVMVSPVDVVATENSASFHFDLPQLSSEKKGTPFFVDTPAGKKARKQLEECVSEILLHQHRTHIFMIHISRDAARLSRWDRSGCVVSEPISLSNGLFGVAISQMARMQPSEQGFDDQVVLATAEQIEILRQYEPRNSYLQTYKDHILKNAEEYPIYEVSCPSVDTTVLERILKKALNGRMPQFVNDDSDEDLDDEGPMHWSMPTNAKKNKYLVGRPTTDRRPLTGRCTVGFVAFDLQARRMVFMKDQWRDANEMYTEMDIYKQLAWRDVDYVARVEAGGEISHHRTRSQRLMGKLCGGTTSRVHVRLVSKQVGRPLETFESGEDLLRYVTGALCGHNEAWLKSRILHHDVSIGNVLIDVEEDIGFLNDWDVAVRRKDIRWKCERSGFGGTWLYGAAIALQYPKKPIELEDDIEAFIWLIVYVAIYHMEHEMSKEEADALANDLFYTCKSDEHGRCVGGATKLHWIKLGKPPVQLKDRSDPVALFLDDAFKALQKIYGKIDYAAIEHWRSGKPDESSFVASRKSKSVLDGLTHDMLYEMLSKACNNWKTWVDKKQREQDEASRKMQELTKALTAIMIGEDPGEDDMPPLGYD